MPFDRDRRGGGGRGFGGGGRHFGGPRRDFGGDRGFGGDRDMPKPVKVGEEYDVEISEVGSRGDGIARVKNFVVFVNNTKQGEKAHIRITEVRNRFAIGEKTSGSAATETQETTESTAEAAEETEEVTETEVAKTEEEEE